MLVPLYQATRRRTPGERNFHLHGRKKLKFEQLQNSNVLQANDKIRRNGNVDDDDDDEDEGDDYDDNDNDKVLSKGTGRQTREMYLADWFIIFEAIIFQTLKFLSKWNSFITSGSWSRSETVLSST